MNTTSKSTTSKSTTSSERPATPRQLMALHYILKCDTRGMKLTYDEASKMIAEKGDPNYKKAAKAKSLKQEFLDYYTEHIAPQVIASMRETLGVETTLTEDTTLMQGTGENGKARTYKMYGFGCSISYLTYDKRSKLAAKIEEVFRECRFKECRDIVAKAFPKSLHARLEREGAPFGALYCQDENINSTLYCGVVAFAKSKGVKNIDYVTRLD